METSIWRALFYLVGIMAFGMGLVIITGGIDLSVGSMLAMIGGLGVVAFDQGAAAQHIRHGHNGALALPDDADSFATATTWLLEDPETLRRVRLNARQYAGRHSWSNISQHLEGYLCSACASPWPN